MADYSFGEGVIDWLLEENNPAVRYRTLTEILGAAPEKEEKQKVLNRLKNLLPANWQEVRGLWGTYWLTAIAQSGITLSDLKDDLDLSKTLDFYELNPFEWGCANFMRLAAMAKTKAEFSPRLLAEIKDGQLPDGGFLCLGRLEKFETPPKSCYKANIHALMFLAECKKTGIETGIEEHLLDYFWRHNIFYRTDNLEKLVLDGREGWRPVDTFFPFEVMRTGIQNIVESFAALGYGSDSRLDSAWEMLDKHKTETGRYILDSTLTKSYLPKEKSGRESKWVTFYALLAQKESNVNGGF